MGSIPLVLTAVCEKGLHSIILSLRIAHGKNFTPCFHQKHVGVRVRVCKSSTSVQKLRKELIGAEESCRRKCGHDPHGSALMQLSLRPSVWPCMGQVQSEKQQRKCLQTRNISVACGCQPPFQYAPMYPVDHLLEDKP